MRCNPVAMVLTWCKAVSVPHYRQQPALRAKASGIPLLPGHNARLLFAFYALFIALHALFTIVLARRHIGVDGCRFMGNHRHCTQLCL